VEHNWAEFKRILQEAVEQFVPSRRQSYNKYRKAIWMTHAAVKKVRRKHNLFRRYRDINNPRYIEAAREARAETRRAKRNFERKLAENIGKDNKSFYAYARSRCSISASTGPILDASGNMKSDPKDIAEELNAYFSSVFTTENTQNMPRYAETDTMNHVVMDELIFTKETVMTKLRKFRSDKAIGADDISPKLLTETSEQICYPLTIIFQKSL
jgi:hypothetical protein